MENADTAMMEMAAAFQRGSGKKKLSPGATNYATEWLSNRVHASNTRWNAVRRQGIDRAEAVGKAALGNSGQSPTINREHLEPLLEPPRSPGSRLRFLAPCPF